MQELALPVASLGFFRSLRHCPVEVLPVGLPRIVRRVVGIDIYRLQFGRVFELPSSFTDGLPRRRRMPKRGDLDNPSLPEGF